tara:strand:- start:512 stop:1516 length:1005 start_codon:yes stop_codon:yes gene_type:complete
MIIKSYELSKIDFTLNNYILFYGKNEGIKTEEIQKITKKKEKRDISYYDEKQILDNEEIFFNNILSGSLFNNEKIIIINRATDKLIKILARLTDKNIQDVLIIVNTGVLEKKSKLRSLFEKEKDFICVPVYPDSSEILSKLAQKYFADKKILISPYNINIIVSKCNGDRALLKNEIEKIEVFARTKKQITTEHLLRLINLTENHSISELIDHCLCKNIKKTINILNENNFNIEDAIIIVRTFLNKSKRILKLSDEFRKNKDLNKTISAAKPPIFWKDKEIVKQQIHKWTPLKIKELIYELNEIELQIKKNSFNAINLISDFILNQSDPDANIQI